LENLAFLTKLAYHSSNIMNSVVVASYHGSPRDPLNEYVYPDAPQFMLRTLIKEAHANLLLLGHTHVPFDLPTPSGSLVNPGSIGQPRDADPRASYAKLEISDDKINCTIKRISYDVQSAANRIIEEKLPTLLADRLFAGI
jgi:predicted phosphodiesterase